MKLQNMQVLTNSQFLFSFAELPDIYWTQISGFKEMFERGDYADPLSAFKRKMISGVRSVDPITVTKNFDQLTDWSLIPQFQDWAEQGTYLSGAITPVKRDGALTLIGDQTLSIENIIVMSYTNFGDLDVGDGLTPAVFTVEFSYEAMVINGTTT